MTSKLILPSEIPWDEIKGSNLEELLYWLFDSMGAKDLEWRIGGKGAGTADQGRDLELSFFTPAPDGTLTKENWGVEAKGSGRTIEPSEVHKAVLNAAGKSHIEVLVIATNGRFSNPTRDWVKEWQGDHPRPKIKLWERTELEKLCSNNPLAIIRLHGRALSPQGKVQVAATKLWDYVSFTDEPTLESIWRKRKQVAIDERALFALVASEQANGDIALRSWALLVSNATLVSTLSTSLLNLFFLAIRADEKGVRQEPLVRAASYLIMVATRRLGRDRVSSLLSNMWDAVKDNKPRNLRTIILEPVLSTLQKELKDVCASDCRRVATSLEMLDEREVEHYWDRLEKGSKTKRKDRARLTVELYKHPCKVGLPLGNKVGCPLCHAKNPSAALEEFIGVVDQVVKFRSMEARKR
ncbi:MAG TPA: restriction endonuclease [Pyrinomonadaceae bacterium]|nr:restriction endonuclease [Pyrinomonadaceae bacterium]